MRLSEEGIGLQYRAEAITEKLYNVDNAEIESKHKQRTYSISLARLATLHHSYGYQKRKAGSIKERKKRRHHGTLLRAG